MRISIISATSENRVIGKNNDLVWHLPADFKFFKDKTRDHAIIMGRKTYESLGKALPKRTNMVVSRNPDFNPGDAHKFSSLTSALEKAKKIEKEEIFIIGGGKIYAQALPFCTHMYLTIVHGNFEGDTFFPEFGKEWKIVDEEFRKADENNSYDFTFTTFEKVNG
jgi:dihydrofolate reductase